VGIHEITGPLAPHELGAIPGVVETELFVVRAKVVYVAGEGWVERLVARR
jgi:ribose 5-phosphate isomerase